MPPACAGRSPPIGSFRGKGDAGAQIGWSHKFDEPIALPRWAGPAASNNTLRSRKANGFAVEAGAMKGSARTIRIARRPHGNYYNCE